MLRTAMCRILWQYGLIIIVSGHVCAFSNMDGIMQQLNYTNKNREKLISYTSEIFCHSHVKVVHVYYENETSLSYPGQILKLVNNCGISHVVVRNKFRNSPLQILRDDGILLYLIMVLRDISQTVELSIIRKKSAAKHLTFILLLIESSSTVTEQWLHSTFEKFWSMWILNVVIMYCRNEVVFSYRYDPFAQQLDRIPLLGNYYIPLDELFPRGLLNMRKKSFRICMYNDNLRSIIQKDGRLMGTDGFMSDFLAERMGANRFVDLKHIYGNISVSRDICFNEIVDELDDLATNIRFLSLATFYKRAEHTIVLSRDDLCVLVPKANVASPFWNLFRSFSINVWILISVSLILAYGLCLILYRSKFAGNKLFLDLLSCIVSTPVARLCNPTTSVRVFIFVWLVYGLLISAAFKANLTSNLVEREYLPDLNTLKDLAESPYPLATLPRHVKHLYRYLNPKNPYEAMIKNKIIEIPDLQFSNLIESNNLSYAYLHKHHLSVFRANARKHSRKGKPLFHVMSQCIVPFHAVYIVPYGSPYLGYINTLMRNAQEFGFLDYWDRMMSAAFQKTRRNTMLNRRNDDEPVVLKLTHFQAAFCVLICGLLIAGICFFWEILNVNIAY